MCCVCISPAFSTHNAVMIQGIDSLMLFKVRCFGSIQISFQFSCFVCLVLCCKQLSELTQQKCGEK